VQAASRVLSRRGGRCGSHLERRLEVRELVLGEPREDPVPPEDVSAQGEVRGLIPALLASASTPEHAASMPLPTVPALAAQL